MTELGLGSYEQISKVMNDIGRILAVVKLSPLEPLTITFEMIDWCSERRKEVLLTIDGNRCSIEDTAPYILDGIAWYMSKEDMIGYSHLYLPIETILVACNAGITILQAIQREHTTHRTFYPLATHTSSCTCSVCLEERAEFQASSYDRGSM